MRRTFLRFHIDSLPFIPETRNICKHIKTFCKAKSNFSTFSFDLHQSSFFNATIRARIVQFILDRQRYRSDNTHDFCFGIDRLLNDETYIAAYPLHDGELTTVGCKRHLLYTKWASLKVRLEISQR